MADNTTISDTVPDLASEALKRSVADFAAPRGPDLAARTEDFARWIDARREAGFWPYTRSLESAPKSEARVLDEDGRPLGGTNFGSQDYLALATHPAVHEAVLRALRDFGPHSASSAVLQGSTRLSRALEQELADFLQLERVLLFPTGWGAGFGAIVGLVRPYDYVVMDKLAHACLQQGAFAATPKVIRHEHLDVDAVREQVGTIRRDDADAGVLVISEGLFSLDSDSPDLRALQETCRELGATLLVDVAHDLASLGPGGTGQIGIQGVLGEIDLVMGSFSKSFASNGGFLASNSRAVTDYVRAFGGTATFSNALSPVQAGVVSQALAIVRSDEGDTRRATLMAAVDALRDSFSQSGIECLGDPSPIVMLPIGAEPVARLAARYAGDRHVLVNVFEFPAVPLGSARFRMQLMAAHRPEDMRAAGRVVSGAVQDAREALAAA
jgi:glycine C-acetyltransferase